MADLGERIIFKGTRYNFVNEREIKGLRHVVYRPDSDDPGPDVVLSEEGDILETVNTERDWDDLDKGKKDIKKHGRKMKKKEKDSLRELDKYEKEAEDDERKKKRKKHKVKKRGN